MSLPGEPKRIEVVPEEQPSLPPTREEPDEVPQEEPPQREPIRVPA